MEKGKKRLTSKTTVPVWELVLTGSLLLLAAGLSLAAREIDGFGQWYAVTIYPVFVAFWNHILGWLPFSAVEMGLYLLLLGIVVLVIRKWRQPWKVAVHLLCIASVLCFLYVIHCGINYYRLPFSAYLDLEVRESSVQELEELCQYLTEQVNETADSAGYRDNLSSYAVLGQQAMEQLGESYPQLAGDYPRPKPVAVSEILSVQQLCGIYAPFTIEANYNRDMPAYNIPHTICHELSHLKGFMREDEANFIGYLACIQSEAEHFRYSGYLMGWIYATNQLARVDTDAYARMYAQLKQPVVEDLKENSRFWDRYEGKVAEAANQLNDVYLKINSQEDGVESYGRMVDLMLAYYRENPLYNHS